MTTAARIRLAAGVLGAALFVQAGLLGHMLLGPSNTYPELKKPLSDLPMKWTVENPNGSPIVWDFKAYPRENDLRSKLPFAAADLLYRYCWSAELNVDAECYIVHAANGEDRKHHPLICIRDVQQIPEDTTGQELISLGEGRKVQRYCFRQNDQTRTTTVYYWHYTFKPVVRDGQTGLQRVYQTFSRSEPSVTVQVMTTANRDRWPSIEKELLIPLDRHLRSEHLPAEILMGCDCLPMAVATK